MNSNDLVGKYVMFDAPDTDSYVMVRVDSVAYKRSAENTLLLITNNCSIYDGFKTRDFKDKRCFNLDYFENDYVVIDPEESNEELIEKYKEKIFIAMMDGCKPPRGTIKGIRRLMKEMKIQDSELDDMLKKDIVKKEWGAK